MTEPVLPLIASVAVAAPLAAPLSYRVPEALRNRVVPGCRVLVPLGRRTVAGCVLGVAPGDGEGLKELFDAPDEAPLFPPAMLPFLLRAADYYRYPPGEAIRSVVPAGLGSVSVRAAVRTERVLLPCDVAAWPRGDKQRAIVAAVREAGELDGEELRRRFPGASAALRRLLDDGWLSERHEERLRDPFAATVVAADSAPPLNPEQATARTQLAAALHAGGFAPFLLHGVTGSGKTEVYLHAIADALALGRSALILVPEIALTPQLVGRFRARFGTTAAIAVLHSGLSDGERYDAWRRIVRDEARIVIGARSAVFAPLAQPGIIVVDEEHDASYKQGEGFRYHARDLALLRGQMADAVVLLGSATPAATTFHRAQSGVTGYLPLTGRVEGRPLPAVEIVDLRGRDPKAAILAPPLAAALAEELAQGGQALLLLNRRGFSPCLLCLDCGAGFHCPNCDISLTYHAGRRRLVCHYCDYAAPIPASCPTCAGARLEPLGAGTERLEIELATAFPEARIARMDRDTTGRKGAHQSLVERMLAGKIDILVGTQMVAKGHDFPGVTLVGVINADQALNLPDFRSAERAFALLAQVAGRAGRGEKPGRVLIQTFAPEHYAVNCAARHDFHGFFAQEVVFRRELGYPPYGHLVNLVFAGNDPAATNRAAEVLAAGLRGVRSSVEILGPASCPLARLRGKSRCQLLLKAGQREPLRRLLAQVERLRKALPGGITLAIDVDPVDML